MQVYGLCHVRKLREVRVFSENRQELADYQKDIEKNTPARVVVCHSPAEAMETADIVITTTPAKQHYIHQSLVKPGMHIVAVGADMAGKNELDPAIFRGAKIVNDSIPQCVSRGETRNAILAGVIGESDIYGEIGQLLAGEKPLREHEDEITIFDTTGMGIQDNVTAVMVYKIALEKGLGNDFEFI